ncbi:bifunctional folylpolyglutamate synthase/dihydrofolate synthase [Haloferula helveola]|uniref:Dihydrofolate synthase/folylpolyglutamate synthase n=1 Tax=Haloferula helveola TaxID=490095 RepID=A0ABM7REI7_9BACT|nr:bifunctional folylpolyglutamate synthase/dihydrofolate synthase [Haloferula helveola]
MNYRDAIDWLFSTQMFGIKLGLEGPTRLLKQFLAFPAHGVKVIHVAGTNGKGSTCAMIDSVARAAGIRSGLFTSPHLIDFRERIRVSGVEIPEEECAELLTQLRELCGRLDPHPTFFEITLAAAMRWFRERECELIVLETGMGGRLDATTAVPADVCAITPVGLDHTQWLGDTLEKVAIEKAGIMVEGKPVISSPQEPEVRRVLEMEANERRSPLEFVYAPLQGYPIGLAGPHQAWNAAVALECLHAAEIPLSYETVHHGLSTVRWPGRFEVIERDGKTVVLDGAHNPDGAKALAVAWKSRFGETKAALVFSAVAAKDIAGIAAQLAPLASEIHLCPVDSPRVVPTEELAKFFTGSTEYPDFAAAFAKALESDAPVLVAGSLFLIGEAKERLEGGDRVRSDQ